MRGLLPDLEGRGGDDKMYCNISCISNISNGNNCMLSYIKLSC